MASDRNNRQEPPPSDVERVQVLARLIQRRLNELDMQERSNGSLPRAESRERHVLMHLRDHWLLEGAD